MTDPRRSLPGVDRVLAEPALQTSLAGLPWSIVVGSVRAAIDEARAQIASNPADASATYTAEGIAERAAALAIRDSRPTLVPVINATGVILHTNLGRAPLAPEAIERVAQAAEGYTNLEFDLEGGVRGSRYVHCESLLCELTGAEAAVVVNNAAAALILAVNTAARGKSVAVSRGELIEIGGGFRIPEIVERAGTQLQEVGTTNRTRIQDFQTAVAEGVGALLKVHRSNFRIEGFSEEASVAQLRELATEARLPLVYDLGSGLMLPLQVPGLPAEPTVLDAVADAPDLVVFSGDKLLGGPQAGVILGSKEWVARVRKNPLTRALRVDRLTLTALEATLELYRDAEVAQERVPVLKMIHTPADDLRGRAEAIVAALKGDGVPDGAVVAAPTTSVVGGGTLPGAEIPSWGVVVAADQGATTVAHGLRVGVAGNTPIVARVHEERVWLDLRTVEPKRDGDLRAALAALIR